MSESWSSVGDVRIWSAKYGCKSSFSEMGMGVIVMIVRGVRHALMHIAYLLRKCILIEENNNVNFHSENVSCDRSMS